MNQQITPQGHYLQQSTPQQVQSNQNPTYPAMPQQGAAQQQQNSQQFSGEQNQQQMPVGVLTPEDPNAPSGVQIKLDGNFVYMPSAVDFYNCPELTLEMRRQLLYQWKVRDITEKTFMAFVSSGYLNPSNTFSDSAHEKETIEELNDKIGDILKRSQSVAIALAGLWGISASRRETVTRTPIKPAPPFTP